MNYFKIIAIAIVFVFASNTLTAQNKWSAEFRPGLSFPTEDIEDTNLKTGFGFELTVAYRFMEHLHGYVGWGYNTFAIEDSDFDLDETGYTFGLQFIHPIGSSESLSYVLRGGAIYNHLELEDGDGNLVDDSGHGLGWQLEAGLDYNLGNDWSLRPTLRYRSLSRAFEIDESPNIDVDLNCLSFGLGVSKSF